MVGGGRSTLKSSSGGSLAFDSDNNAGVEDLSSGFFLDEDDADDPLDFGFSCLELLDDDDVCLLECFDEDFDEDAVGSIIPGKNNERLLVTIIEHLSNFWYIPKASAKLVPIELSISMMSVCLAGLLLLLLWLPLLLDFDELDLSLFLSWREDDDDDDDEVVIVVVVSHFWRFDD